MSSRLFIKIGLQNLFFGCSLGPSAPEAESSFGAPGNEGAEVSTGRDVVMGGTAPADAELLDDADTETAGAAAERSAAVFGSVICIYIYSYQQAYQEDAAWYMAT